MAAVPVKFPAAGGCQEFFWALSASDLFTAQLQTLLSEENQLHVAYEPQAGYEESEQVLLGYWKRGVMPFELQQGYAAILI